ncbi:MAG: hypothetical protein JSU04_18160 [Bdellovibrionales bacterium]|nr:hypothetical protein [Bdellovibrionales bacterium]
MKQTQIVKILAAEFGTVDVNELNKLFRQKDAPKTKYRLSGENLGHIGVTGLIKMITTDGVKVIGETRTTLVRFDDIEGFAKAKPRSERAVHTSPKKKVTAVKKSALEEALEDDDEDDGDYSDLLPEVVTVPKKKRRPVKPIGKSGSKFIPKEKK